MNGRKGAKKNLQNDPDYYRNIRKKRVSYPKNDGMFTSRVGRNVARKRWDDKKPKDPVYGED